MKHAQQQIAPANDTPDVLEHLAGSLDESWKRYCKRLRRCQKSFSEDAVHDSRVETRRLISLVDLLGAFLPKKEIGKVRSALKEHLDTFDELRDTHVQLLYVEQIKETFPAADALRDWLRKREMKFTRRTSKAIKAIRTKRLKRGLTSFKRQISRLRQTTTPSNAFLKVQRELNRAFDGVSTLCSRVHAEDTETIHRTRVAFKRFRYMVESLSSLLPAVNDRYRQSMRGYQSMMGDIQDAEVLLEAFDKFLKKKKIKSAESKKLQMELLRRRRLLIRVYLNAAGKLKQFWPPPGLAAAAEKLNLGRAKT